MTRRDAAAKTAGATAYGTDLSAPRMLWGAYVTSAHPRAKILSIDTKAPRDLPGVVAVLSAADLPVHLPPRETPLDPPLLATGSVRYLGEPVAIVAAESRAEAQAAARRVIVRYEPEPAFTDIEAEFPTWPEASSLKGDPRVTGHVLARRGTFDDVARHADLVVEETFRTSMVAQVPLETHACLVTAEGNGWHVRTTTQTPFGLREDLADKLGVPQSRVRVEGTWVGGGFGGKNEALLESHAAVLATATGRPVRFALDFREEFLMSRTTQPAIYRMSVAVKGGRMVARRTRLLLDTGASLPGRDFALGYSLGFTLGPYVLDAWEVEGFALRTNRPPFGPHRAPLAPQCVFAAEGIVDATARKLGVDPVEFRRRHIWKAGSKTPFGQAVGPFAAAEALRRAGEMATLWRRDLPPHHGLGVAVGYWSTGTGAGGEARIRLGPEGMTIVQGEREIGNGTIVETLAAVASEACGLPRSAIRVEYADTSSAPFDSGVFGSRTASTLGFAVWKATMAALEEVSSRAGGARRKDEPAARLAWDGSEVVVERGGARIPLKGLLRPEEIRAGGLEREGKHYGGPGALDESVVVEGSLFPYSDFTASVHLAHVAVDEETGAVRVVRYAAFQDPGVVLDPEGFRGQVEGGVVMGLGTALSEEGIVDVRGGLTNPNLLDYRLPTLGDVPPLTIVALEGFPGAGVRGAKGIGEPPIIPVPAAVANAVADATGARVTEIPLSPERVARALELISPGAPGGRRAGRVPEAPR